MPAPVIERVSPTSGWPGGTASDGSAVDGTLVIIHGRYFHPTAEMDRNQVTFTASAGGTVPAPVLWASINEIDYQPDGIVATEASVPAGRYRPARTLAMAHTPRHHQSENNGSASCGITLKLTFSRFGVTHSALLRPVIFIGMRRSGGRDIRLR